MSMHLGADIQTSIVPIGHFRAIEFIELLIELTPNYPQDYPRWIELAQDTLASLRQRVNGKRDEHAFALAEFVCVIVQHGGTMKADVWAWIGWTFERMTLDYPLLDGKMRNYMLAINKLSQFTLEERISKSMVTLVGYALLVNDDKFPTARPMVVQMVLGLPERYAERSALLHILLTELPKYEEVDWRLLAQVIAPCAAVAGLMGQAGPNLVKNLKVFRHLMQALAHVRPGDGWYDGAFAVVSTLVGHGSGQLRILLDQSPKLLLPFFGAACNKAVAHGTRVFALKALQSAVMVGPNQVGQVYGDTVVASTFDGPEIDQFVAILLKQGFTNQRKCAEEFVAVMRSARSLDERRLTLAELGSALTWAFPEFVKGVRESGVLRVILQCKTSPAVDVESLCTLAGRVIEASCTSDERSALRELAEREPKSALHAHVLELLSTSYR